MKIKNLAQLVNALNQCNTDRLGSCYLETMKSIQIPLKEWEKYFHFKDNRPAWVCLSSTGHYELYLSCWEEGQKGPIHDVDSKEAWIHPVFGEFIEQRFKVMKDGKKIEQVSAVILSPMCYSYFQDTNTICRHINAASGRSACLHLYSGPIEEWMEYNEISGDKGKVEHECDVSLEEEETQ